MREKRTKDRIILEILSLCIEGKNITKIVYTVNTSFAAIRKYLDLLITHNMIETIDGSPVLYKTTGKGMAMIERLQVLQEELAGIWL
jgi:predicted transcriptional regulator